MTLAELAKSFIVIREKRAALKREDEDLKGEQEQIEQQMIPKMQELEAQNLKLEGVGTVFLKTVPYAAVVKGMEDEFISWLDSHGQGALAPRRIHDKTLKSQYQQWTELDQPLPPETMVTAFQKTSVHINKSAVKAK